MTSYDTQEDVRRAVHAGAKAFLTKVADPQEICEAVRLVADGETYFPADVRTKLAESFSQAELSKREIEVFARSQMGMYPGGYSRRELIGGGHNLHQDWTTFV